MIGNGRADWQIEERCYSTMLADVPDGSFLSRYVVGRDIYPGVYATMGRAEAYFDATESQFVKHLSPNPNTFSKPYGEVRLHVTTATNNGIPTVVTLGFAPAGSTVPTTISYVRSASLDVLCLAGKYTDKDVSLTLDDAAGRTGLLHGRLVYLGRSYSLSGRRIMGRAGFAVFDDSRPDSAGAGYLIWEPSGERLNQIRARESRDIDQIRLFFSLRDGSTASGIHKYLKRST